MACDSACVWLLLARSRRSPCRSSFYAYYRFGGSTTFHDMPWTIVVERRMVRFAGSGSERVGELTNCCKELGGGGRVKTGVGAAGDGLTGAVAAPLALVAGVARLGAVVGKAAGGGRRRAESVPC